jgi:hypothetical protein
MNILITVSIQMNKVGSFEGLIIYICSLKTAQLSTSKKECTSTTSLQPA